MILYNYKGQPNTLNKILTKVGEINVTLRPEINTRSPRIKIINPPQMYTFNYVYVPEFGKYYFVSDYKFIGGNTYLLSLQIDLLQTYKEQILQGSGLIVESDKANRKLSVNTNVFDVFPHTDILHFPKSQLFDKEGDIVMVTLKGNK